MKSLNHPKRFLTGKAVLLLLLALSLLFSVTAASADGSSRYNIDYSNLENRIRNVYIFKFYNQEGGIGYGNCPVYTAPYDDALRLANGRASCDTNSYMSVGGYDATGWLMVRYQTNENKTRVGYIPPQYVRGYRARINLLQFDYIPVVADSTIYVTDNPISNSTSFAALGAGETFYILGKYTYVGNWWYIECYVDGQPARGFIDIATSPFQADGASFGNGDSGYNPAVFDSGSSGGPVMTGNRIGTVTVRGTFTNSDARIVRSLPNSDSDIVARVYDGERYPCYDITDGAGHKKWYKILVNEGWGWISSGVSVLDYD